MNRWMLALIGAAVSVIVVAMLILWNWRAASPPDGTEGLRLRWYVTVKKPVPAGTVLASANLEQRLGRLPGDLDVSPLDEAKEHFAAMAIEPVVPVERRMILKIPSVTVPAGGAVVAVEVATDHTSALVPGMQLAFVSEKEMLPSAKELAKKNAEPAFTLLAIAPSPRTANTTSLLVAVPACRLQLIDRLGAKILRPVILRR